MRPAKKSATMSVRNKPASKYIHEVTKEKTKSRTSNWNRVPQYIFTTASFDSDLQALENWEFRPIIQMTTRWLWNAPYKLQVAKRSWFADSNTASYHL